VIDETPILRPAARVLLIDPDDRLLLFKFRVDGSNVWITPGGGVDRGETFEQGALRELWEETGLTGCELGPCVWMRSFLFRWDGKLYKQQERFFVVRTWVTEITDVNWTA
jgi:8-oxo-dGTP diphosphatase